MKIEIRITTEAEDGYELTVMEHKGDALQRFLWTPVWPVFEGGKALHGFDYSPLVTELKGDTNK